ncbi:MAG: heme lyase CcmF/NrfE family subunit, partial [Nitrospinae bacterium]|nr:heme lyase CcmF/NrfE family subunit [Nitrospinota bacterium]
MMTEIGEFSIFIAFVVSIYAFIVSIIGTRRERRELLVSAENTIYIVCILIIIASSALIYAFVTRDFSIEYVYSYSNRDLPIFYTISAFWGGQKGSLLLWELLLSIFGSIVLLQNRHKNRELMRYVILIIMAINTFFIGLMIFSSNPFERLPYIPEDGRGLNPLLQNPGMIFHPPFLYLGYVGFTIPFSFAISALMCKELSDTWIKTTRGWTITSWFFLSLGNLSGAWWAYRVLGWGGYWAWDPVENASFMPWLVGTAYLHSVMVQEKKDMLKVWNMFLIVLTFILTIFGTFITRSGLIKSVHAFDETTLGYYFLVFMCITILFSGLLILDRLPMLRSKNELDSFISRESSFLFNNLILVGITFATFWGTIFPLISEAVRGVKITVGSPFYNQVNLPFGMALLFLTGICPLIAWRKASARNLMKNFLRPFIISIIGGVILFLLPFIFQVMHRDISLSLHDFPRSPFTFPIHLSPFTLHLPNMAWISLTLSIFVISTIISEFYKGTMVRREMTGENIFRSLFMLISRNKRRYGGYIIHIGVVFMFIGITGSYFTTEVQKTLKIGESISVKDYRLTYEDISYNTPYPNKDEVIATLSVEKNGKKIWRARPEKEFFANWEQPSTIVDILSTLKEDLYIILGGFQEDSTASFKVIVNPLLKWLWIGGIVISLGTLVVMWPDT